MRFHIIFLSAILLVSTALAMEPRDALFAAVRANDVGRVSDAIAELRWVADDEQFLSGLADAYELALQVHSEIPALMLKRERERELANIALENNGD